TYIRLWRIQAHSSEEAIDISVEKKVFQAYEEQWEVKLEAVLAGHEGWVYGVQWHPPLPEPSGAWVERVRLGEVGGSGLGFYGSRYGPGGEVLAHGYNGSFHIWSCCKLARPQVHGYDMQSLALVNGTKFASAAEEKVIRVFEAPTNFIHNFANITGEVLEERSDR
ncbi:Uncharacterized protein OBRU01_26547, partial [Operophtera brumata]